MGQGQSSQDAGSDTAQDVPLKKDYYELLGVERTASDDEIKRAYRRKALEFHPDRNYGDVESATQLFAEVQSAYEVLSDPQERAWYDSHRDVLLRGDTVGGQSGEDFSYDIRMTTADEVLKLMMKFDRRMEFTDSPSGFYGGLHEFFSKLAKEEDIAAQWEDLEAPDYPEFGAKDDDYDNVVRPFYAAWNGFATRKSYSWKDQYRLSEAPDRRIRRLMEKENRKLRDEAIQEFNDAVRSLIAFVRKRDPRVQKNQKSEAERQKALKEAAAAQAARSRAARNAELENYVVPEWAQSRSKDEHEGGFSSESDAEQHEYECVVCDKTFKSEAQFRAHEKSKKHVKLLKQLQREMRKEGKDLDLSKANDEHVAAGNKRPDDDEHDGDVVPEDSSESGNNVYDLQQANLSDDENNSEEVEKSKSISDEDGGEETDATDDDDDGNDDNDKDYAPRSEIESRLMGNKVTSSTDDLTSSLRSSSLVNAESTDLATNTGPPTELHTMDPATGASSSKPGKAKQKRAKKAAAAVQAQEERSAAVAASRGSAGGDTFACQKCGAGFDSKTKLFKHIKAEGHVALKSELGAPGNGDSSGHPKAKKGGGKKR